MAKAYISYFAYHPMSSPSLILITVICPIRIMYVVSIQFLAERFILCTDEVNITVVSLSTGSIYHLTNERNSH